MSVQPAWKRSWNEALADGVEKEQRSISKVASVEGDSDEELILKKQVKSATFLAYGDTNRTSARKNKNENKLKNRCTAENNVDKTNQNRDHAEVSNLLDQTTLVSTEEKKTNEKRERQRRNRKMKRAPLPAQGDTGLIKVPPSPSQGELRQLLPNEELSENLGAHIRDSCDKPSGTFVENKSVCDWTWFDREKKEQISRFVSS